MQRSTWTAFAAVFALPCFFAGCGGGSSGKPTVAFVSNNAFEFWTIARRGTEKAAKEFDVLADFEMPARGDTSEQRAIIEDLLAKDVKGIAISPIDAENQATFLGGVAKRVPLLTQDSDLPPGSGRLCYIGTDNYTAGMAAGKLIRECLPEGGKIVIYVGKLEAQNAKEHGRACSTYWPAQRCKGTRAWQVHAPGHHDRRCPAG